ncbi:MAG TPA: amidohydrolase family protein [Pyrinomonadaceae bacterium]|jgi:5-methylthioadenosine/S-adenosylhomocysteine deaminase|nr:amidohydrolase family protein [Pyrinomonadaceae bacterium]
MPKLYSARWVLPIASPTIDNGAVLVDDSVIVAVGARADLQTAFPHEPHEDFGNAAILPGLINAHSHLELTIMRGFLEREEHDFFAWLKKLTIARLKMTDEDLFVSAACGAIEAARAGITCLGDSSSFAAQSMRAITAAGLRAIVYQESFGPDPKLAEENVGKLRAQLDAMRQLQTNLVRAGVSPHAPYTVSAPQLEMISRLALNEGLPLMMHAAESQAERQFLQEGAGPFAEGLKARGIEWRAPGVSTIRYLHDHGILDARPLLAHCINVDDDDLRLIKDAAAGIAHCPKSNAKLGHGRAPFAGFIAHGINFGLGSDSVASNNVCDILEEARFATLLARLSRGRSRHVGNEANAPVSAQQSLFAATLGGARALRVDEQVGALREGLQADIAIVNLAGSAHQPVRDPHDALVFSASGRDVRLTIVAGKEIYRNQRVLSVDEKELQSRLEHLSRKLDSD